MNDTKLIQAIKSSDEKAIALLMEKNSKLLWKIAGGILQKTGSENDIEEVVADVFIHIWQHPDSFDLSKGSLKNYLCVLCKSKAIDRFRNLSRSISVDIDSLPIADYFDPERSIIKQEELGRIYEAIDSLPPEDQMIFARRFIYGQKPKSIAKATGLNIRRVENTLYRSKLKIRDLLNQGE